MTINMRANENRFRAALRKAADVVDRFATSTEKRRLREENERLRFLLACRTEELKHHKAMCAVFKGRSEERGRRIADLEVLLESARTAILRVREVVGKLPLDPEEAASS
jgi:hypothetical protein